MKCTHRCGIPLKHFWMIFRHKQSFSPGWKKTFLKPSLKHVYKHEYTHIDMHYMNTDTELGILSQYCFSRALWKLWDKVKIFVFSVVFKYNLFKYISFFNKNLYVNSYVDKSHLIYVHYTDFLFGFTTFTHLETKELAWLHNIHSHNKTLEYINILLYSVTLDSQWSISIQATQRQSAVSWADQSHQLLRTFGAWSFWYTCFSSNKAGPREIKGNFSPSTSTNSWGAQQRYFFILTRGRNQSRPPKFSHQTEIS